MTEEEVTFQQLVHCFSDLNYSDSQKVMKHLNSWNEVHYVKNKHDNKSLLHFHWIYQKVKCINLFKIASSMYLISAKVEVCKLYLYA